MPFLFLVLAALLAGDPGITITRRVGAAPIVTLAWDANTDNTIGYKVHYGTATRNYTTHVDVGNVTTTNFTLPPGTYFFAVSAYNQGGDSGYSAEVSGALTDPPVDQCAPPLGNRFVSVVTTRWTPTTGQPGSQAWVQFQLASPNSPITQIVVKLNGAAVSTTAGASLNRSAGVWFDTPIAPGTYALTVDASNAFGCHGLGTKDARGLPMNVVVKP